MIRYEVTVTHVKIHSDGTAPGTKIFLNGEELTNVKEVHWSIHDRGPAQVTLTLFCDELDVSGQMSMKFEGQSKPSRPLPYPPGMGEESRRLHREYNRLVRDQRAGAKNGPEVVKLTDECNAKGIILVPGGEDL